MGPSLAWSPRLSWDTDDFVDPSDGIHTKHLKLFSLFYRELCDLKKEVGRMGER